MNSIKKNIIFLNLNEEPIPNEYNILANAYYNPTYSTKKPNKNKELDLSHGFSWLPTKQGYSFWRSVYYSEDFLTKKEKIEKNKIKNTFFNYEFY